MSDNEIIVSKAEFDDLLTAKKIVVSKADLVALLAEKDSLRYEVERLRLTDEERVAVERAADLVDNKTCGDSSTLRGLLERTK